jgi:hypothetical protein
VLKQQPLAQAQAGAANAVAQVCLEQVLHGMLK